MRYDFDRMINRKNTDSAKWDRNEQLFGREDVLPMWVADMDFPCPRPVLEAVRERLEHPILGYSFPPDSVYEAIQDRLREDYEWEVKREWITFTPGVVNGVYAAVDAVSEAGDEIILQPPVYYPFFGSVKNNGCHIVNNRLKRKRDGYVMDFADLERHFETTGGFGGRQHRIRGLVLCSPHNPVGRVWSEKELGRLAEICLANDCVIISDEIHCDLLIGEAEHIPTATISPEAELNTITLMAPSKTYNLAGMKASFAVIPDPDLREAFTRARTGQSGVNVLGMVAMEAALREGQDYLEQLRDYLTENVRYFTREIFDMPGLRIIPPEGTYLAWVDMSGLGMDDEQLAEFMVQRVGVATDFGYVFGPGGEGFQRFNLACPREMIRGAVENLREALSRLETKGQ